MREELAVGLAHGFPVHAVHRGVKEAGLLFGEDIVEEIFALADGVDFLFGLEGYRLHLAA